MAKTIHTEIQIQASDKQVWDILTDTRLYPEWNPFITSMTGKLAVGEIITAEIKPPGSKGMTFKPRILVMEAQKELKWLGHLLFKGLFDGEHRFEIIEQGDGSCVFKQSEVFTGILVPLFAKSLDEGTRKGFEQMNAALKARAEG